MKYAKGFVMMIICAALALASGFKTYGAAQFFNAFEGVIQSIAEDGDVTMLTVDTTESQYKTVVINVFNDTFIIDNITGLALNPKALKAGEKICAYTSPVMTRSLPPQTSAIAIVANITDKPESVAKYMRVADVQENGDGSIKISSTDGMYVVTILPITPINHYGTNETAEITDIKAGSEIFVWFKIMTLSIPAQATADKVVLLDEPADTPKPNEQVSKYSGLKNFDKITINGRPFILDTASNIVMENGTVMVPLRSVFTPLGYVIEWDEATKTAAIYKKGITSSMQIGSKSYRYDPAERNSTAPVLLNEAPRLINGVTFVPIQYIELICGESSVSVKEGVLCITVK